MRVLSLDPGKTNFGLTVVDTDGRRIRVVHARIVKSPINDMKDLDSVAKRFIAELRQIESDYGPFDAVCAERFQSRGGKGVTIEVVNVMLGILYMLWPNIGLYTAATWKNAFNRANPAYALNDVYSDFVDMVAGIKKSNRHTVHELDAALQGIYHACKLTNTPFYETLSSYARITSFLKHFQSMPIV